VRNPRITLALLAASVVAATIMGASNTKPVVADDDRRIAIRDDCDRDDPAWTPTGGCSISGDVTFAEFGGELSSPNSSAVIGHQGWRNDPPYLTIEQGETVGVRNRGGRTHTFTEVASFGGGKIGPPLVGLNQGLMTAPECPTSVNMPPGASVQLPPLAPGNHRFQCCIHPWMRAIIKVKPDDEGDEE
jgi:plastocyanin